MTGTTSINKDQLYRGNKPQSKSWLKKWLFRAAFVGTLVLGEHILKSSVHSDGWVNTVNAQTLRNEVDKVKLAKTALAQLKEARESSRDKRPGMALVKSTPARNNFLDTLTKLGLIEGTEPMDRFASYVKKFKNPGQSDSKSYPTAEKNIERELNDMTVARGLNQAVSAKMKAQPGKVTPPLVAGKPTIKATPKVIPKYKPEPLPTQAQIQAALPDFKLRFSQVLDYLEAIVRNSKFGRMRLNEEDRTMLGRKNAKVNVKKELLAYISELRDRINGKNKDKTDKVTDMNGLGGAVYNLPYVEAVIKFSVSARNMLEGKDSSGKDYSKHPNYKQAVNYLNEAIIKFFIKTDKSPFDPEGAIFSAVMGLGEVIRESSTSERVQLLRGPRWWFTSEMRSITSTEAAWNDKLNSAITAANKVFKRMQDNKVSSPRLNEAKLLVADIYAKAKKGEIKDPERQFHRIRSAIISPLVFEEARVFVKEAEAWGKGFPKDYVLSVVSEAEKIYDKGILSTTKPDAPAEMVLKALNNALGPAAAMIENGFAREFGNIKGRENPQVDKKDTIEYAEDRALNALTIAREIAKPWDKVSGPIGFRSASALVYELFVMGRGKSLHKPGRDTVELDMDIQYGGMLNSELQISSLLNDELIRQDIGLRSVSIDRAKSWNYPIVEKVLRNQNNWLAAESQLIKATKGHLGTGRGAVVKSLLGKKRNMGDLTPDEIKKLADTLLPKHRTITRDSNQGFYFLIRDVMEDLKREFKIGGKEDFVAALQAERNRPETSDAARKHYDRAIDYLGRVVKLQGVMNRNMDKDLFGGSVPSMYANPHRTFELLIGAATSVEDARREPPMKVKPSEFPVEYFLKGLASSVDWRGDNNFVHPIVKIMVRYKDGPDKGKEITLEEYAKKVGRTPNLIVSWMLFEEVGGRIFLLNPRWTPGGTEPEYLGVKMGDTIFKVRKKMKDEELSDMTIYQDYVFLRSSKSSEKSVLFHLKPGTIDPIKETAYLKLAQDRYKRPFFISLGGELRTLEQNDIPFRGNRLIPSLSIEPKVILKKK